MYGAEGTLRSEYERAGVELTGPHRFSFDPRHPLRDAGGILAPARWVRRQGADALWLNRIEHLVWAQGVARLARCPLVCQLHGPPVYHRMRAVGRGVAHFVAVSDFIRQAYIDRGIEPERISRVYNALPPGQYPTGGLPERAAARKGLGLPAETPLVLCYGQMTAEKGVVTLLEAWRRLWPTSGGAVLVLVDSTSERPDPVVAGALGRLDPGSYRVFPIASDVVPFLHACDVVAFPTLLPEAFGRVVIEGMATGRPAVASRVGAVPEILSGPMARFLVEPGCVEQLTEKLASLLDWRRREPGLGEECTGWVDRRFRFDAHVDQLEEILLRHRRRRARPW
jgi:glycosyltransferase involved in cell wall biosynthesis